MSFTLSQQRALAVMPKITGFASLFGSSIIVTAVLRDVRKRSKAYHRLLLGISCVDMSSSLWFALSTWPIPEESGVIWASGTDTSCNLQAFFTQFSITSSLYNVSLSIYYLLVIKMGWKEEQVRKLEPFLHMAPIVWGLSTAATGLGLGLYGNANLWCWIAAGNDVYRMAFFYGPLWLSIVMVTVNILLIQRHVKQVEARAQAHTFRSSMVFFSGRSTANSTEADDSGSMKFGASTAAAPAAASALAKVAAEVAAEEDDIEKGQKPGNSHLDHLPQVDKPDKRSMRQLLRTSKQRSQRPGLRSSRQSRSQRSKAIARQCFWYAASFFITWFALSVVRVIQLAGGTPPYVLVLLASINTPCQGLPNFCIYLCPKITKLRKEHPEAGIWWLIRHLLWTPHKLSSRNDTSHHRNTRVHVGGNQ